MTKKAFYLLAAAISLAAVNASAADSTMTINGNVRDISCDVTTKTQNFDVDLKSSSVKQLDAVGATTPAESFSIVLTCGSSVRAVKIGFTGVAEEANTSLLKLDGGASAAAGMGIQILDAQRNMLPINPSSSVISWTALTPGQVNTLLFYARLMVTRAPVTAGHVKATANFTLEFQ